MSTLRSNDNTICSTATAKTYTNSSRNRFSLPSTIPSDNPGDQGSVMTMESYQQLDTRITGLSSQLLAQQQRSNPNTKWSMSVTTLAGWHEKNCKEKAIWRAPSSAHRKKSYVGLVHQLSVCSFVRVTMQNMIVDDDENIVER